MTALADALRAAGLAVVEHHAPPRSGAFTPRGVLLHHTAGAATGDAPSLGYCISGQEGGPMCNLLIARSGTVHLITEGRAWHAGSGSSLVGAGIPADQGNQYLWGIEVESTGTAPDWPPAQWDATHTAARVLLDLMGADSGDVWRHRDYTPRKIDTVYPLPDHRAAVDSGPLPSPIPPTDPGEEDMKALIVEDGTGGTWVVAADLSSKCPLGDPNWTAPRLMKTGCYVEAELDGDTFKAVPDVRYP